jgi:hypothetical protein
MKMLDEHVGFDDHHQLIRTTDFSFNDVDAALGFIHQSPPEARELAAEMFRQIMDWCFRSNRSLRVATAKFSVIAGGLRPNLLGDRTMDQIASELGVTKQLLSHYSLKFSDAFQLKFARSRSAEAREHMATARRGGPARNIKLPKQSHI